MLSQKNTSTGGFKNYLKIIIKIILIISVLFVVVVLLNKIDLPLPKKDIEKIIPNENLKIIK